MAVRISRSESWPSLPLGAWRDTYATLHMWSQIVGKTRLSLAPMVNHWWQATFYVTARGLGTSPIPCGERTFEVEFDFLDDVLAISTSDAQRRTMALVPRTVADFYREYLSLLRALGIEATIWPKPVEVATAIPFAEDLVHASYDADAARRCWRILVQADRVLKEFRSRFTGKCSQVHLFWGSFDLAYTRFSGRPAPPHPGGIPNCPDWVTREAYSRECMSVGWWPGSVGGALTEPAFYAYAYPEPEGLSSAAVQPGAAYYSRELREFILPYEAVRTAALPDVALLEFFQSTYDAAADLAAWDRGALERFGDVRGKD
jgi:hypothetical protein